MKKTLSVISGTGSPKPDPSAMPAGLGPHGQSLWKQVQAEFAVDDVGGTQTLFQICMSCDMAHRLREHIDRDGEVVTTRSGVREHPLLKAELAHRSFVVRTLQRLGITLEPVRPMMGRPSPYA